MANFFAGNRIHVIQIVSLSDSIKGIWENVGHGWRICNSPESLDCNSPPLRSGCCGWRAYSQK